MDRSTTQPPVRARLGASLGDWLRAHAPELLFALLLLAVFPMRDLWAPDEPDFAQCVKEMRLRGDWLLPYLNGVPYSEKPILYYWVMKASSLLMDALTGGLGFTQGVAAWALRLPSVIAAVAFLSVFRRGAVRFLEPDLAEPAGDSRLDQQRHRAADDRHRVLAVTAVHAEQYLVLQPSGRRDPAVQVRGIQREHPAGSGGHR